MAGKFHPGRPVHLGEAPELRNFMWLQDSIRLASNLPEEQGRSLPNGSSMDTLRWIFRCGHPPFPSIPGQRTLSLRTHRRSPGIALRHALAFFQPETSRGIRRSVFHDRLKDAGACFGKWPDGNGLTGLPLKAWNHVTSTLTADRTGSKLCIRAPCCSGKCRIF